MPRYPHQAGLPTASKEIGANFYVPALTRSFKPPQRIKGLTRYPTRGQAKGAAKRWLEDAVRVEIDEHNAKVRDGRIRGLEFNTVWME